MLSSVPLLASFLLLGNTLAFPHFPVQRDAATCTQDNLLRCFINTKSMDAATALCAGLTPFTQTVATVTASTAITTQTTVVASTQTNGVTVLITSTIVVPVIASTIYVNAQSPVKRSAMAPPNCYTAAGTTYAASRLTSACSCIGVPASTVLGYTYTASTSTATSISTVDITTTTSFTTTSTALESDTTSLTTTLTTTSSALPSTTACGAPSSQNLVSNPGFECPTLSPWTTLSTYGGDAYSISSTGSNSASSLYTSSSFYANSCHTAGGSFSQTLATTIGETYVVKFDMHMDGGGGNTWSVVVGGTVIASNANTGKYGQQGWQTYTGSFTAATTSDALSVTFYSVIWAYADWEWDNFVVSPAP